MHVRVRARGYVQVADRRHAVQPVLEGGKGGGLGEEHEEPVETFVEMRVSFGLKELHAEICRAISLATLALSLENIHVKTGDSSSCTSLSI